MPLDHSKSKSAFTNNVKTLMNDVGKSPHVQSKAQALAIAYSTQREAKGRAMGGIAPQAFNPMMPGTGMPQTPLNAPPSGVAAPAMMGAPMGLNAGMAGPAGARPFAAGGGVQSTFKGPIVSAVPGRTDNHFAHVPSGSYVIPADIVSAHGQGNTLAGMQALHKLFKMDPHPIQHLARGGAAKHVGKPVPVRLAGGEIVVPPENAHETMCRVTGKKLTLDQAHAALDKWVVSQRKKLRKTLAKLPGPARD